VLGVSELARGALEVDAGEFRSLVSRAVELLSSRSGGRSWRLRGRLVELSAVGEAVVVGDVHGKLEDLVHVLRDSRFLDKVKEGEDVYLVFLGDYGDRGVQGPEVYYVVLRLLLEFPDRVFLLRGNHEGPSDLMPYPHDLPFHLRMKFGEGWENVYGELRRLFDALYTAVLVKGRYIMLHGGVPSGAESIDDVAYAHELHPEKPHYEEILWSDPEDGISGVYPSPRGAGKLFGRDVTERFLRLVDAKVLIRGHEPCDSGYKVNHDGLVLTLFSMKGAPYYNSRGAYLLLDLAKDVENAFDLLDFVRSF